MIQKFTCIKHPDGGVTIHLSNLAKQMHFKDITEDQMLEGMTKYDKGERIQKAFHFLNADQREFLMTGITSEEWEYIFAPLMGLD